MTKWRGKTTAFGVLFSPLVDILHTRWKQMARLAHLSASTCCFDQHLSIILYSPFKMQAGTFDMRCYSPAVATASRPTASISVVLDVDRQSRSGSRKERRTQDSTSSVLLESQVPSGDVNATTPWSLSTVMDQPGNKRKSNSFKGETLRAPNSPFFRDGNGWETFDGKTALAATTRTGLGVVEFLDAVDDGEELFVEKGLCGVDDHGSTSPVCQSLNVLNTPYTCEEVCQHRTVSRSFAGE